MTALNCWESINKSNHLDHIRALCLRIIMDAEGTILLPVIWQYQYVDTLEGDLRGFRDLAFHGRLTYNPLRPHMLPSWLLFWGEISQFITKAALFYTHGDVEDAPFSCLWHPPPVDDMEAMSGAKPTHSFKTEVCLRAWWMWENDQHRGGGRRITKARLHYGNEHFYWWFVGGID